MRQSQQNSVLLRQALAELQELKQQVQNQRKFPFTVKTCGFEVGQFESLIYSTSHQSVVSNVFDSNLKIITFLQVRLIVIIVNIILCDYNNHD